MKTCEVLQTPTYKVDQAREVLFDNVAIINNTSRMSLASLQCNSGLATVAPWRVHLGRRRAPLKACPFNRIIYLDGCCVKFIRT
ncbi:hypothetical protein EVAR_60103_1 [Eumeta japonica]|uniref:Uncharacterized protein n=1 Tax=Eumeta variegata TaxID=151549 RepID=A0A4C1Z246_EUMVA|nr:hypothetical protein EVAR_60103_1 [Eumeta japonica]